MLFLRDLASNTYDARATTSATFSSQTNGGVCYLHWAISWRSKLVCQRRWSGPAGTSRAIGKSVPRQARPAFHCCFSWRKDRMCHRGGSPGPISATGRKRAPHSRSAAAGTRPGLFVFKLHSCWADKPRVHRKTAAQPPKARHALCRAGILPISQSACLYCVIPDRAREHTQCCGWFGSVP